MDRKSIFTYVVMGSELIMVTDDCNSETIIEN